MANTIQIKRGQKSNIPTFLSGELGFATDTQEIFVGTGSSNIRILTEDDLYTDSDVDSHLSGGTGINYSSGSISIDSTVTQNSDTDISLNSWVLDEDDFVSNSNTKVATQQSIKSYIASTATLNTDTDVSGNSWVLDEYNFSSNSATKVATQQSIKTYVDNTVSNSESNIDPTLTKYIIESTDDFTIPDKYQMMVHDPEVNGNITVETGGELVVLGEEDTLDGLSDTNISSISDGQILKYDATNSEWVNDDLSLEKALSDLTDVSISSPSDGNRLEYNSGTGKWENISSSALSFIQLTSADTTDLSATHIIQWDSQLNVVGDSLSHDTTTNNTRITANESGYYRVYSSIIANASNYRSAIQGWIKKNGTKLDVKTSATEAYNSGSPKQVTLWIEQYVQLTSGDYVEIEVEGYGSYSSNITDVQDNASIFLVHKLD